MCKHCKTILSILRDAEVIISKPGDDVYDEHAESPYVYLEFEHKPRQRAGERAKKLGEAMLNICGNRGKNPEAARG